MSGDAEPKPLLAPVKSDWHQCIELTTAYVQADLYALKQLGELRLPAQL